MLRKRDADDRSKFKVKMTFVSAPADFTDGRPGDRAALSFAAADTR